MKDYPVNWDDMSNFVVHFTKRTEDEDDYSNIMGICSQQTLLAEKRFGIGKDNAPKETEQRAVCFSEIPPGQWDRLINRRGTKYGLAFTKEYIVSRGGGPIWYARQGTPPWKTLQDMMMKSSGDPSAPIWSLTPFIDAPGSYDRSNYEFDWEREWRHVGSLSFSTEDVAFLLIPEEQHNAAFEFFKDAETNKLGPPYFCPYVDPSWDRKRILTLFAGRAKRGRVVPGRQRGELQPPKRPR